MPDAAPSNVDDDTVIIGDAVLTAEGEQLIVETPGGMFFAWRKGNDAGARYIVEDVLSSEELAALDQSDDG